MQVEQLEMPKEKAQTELEAIRELFKRDAKAKKNKILSDLRSAYNHMRHGGKIVDAYQAFKDAGLNRDGHPKLAVVKADSKIVVFNGYDGGIGRFYHDRGQGSSDDYWRWIPNRFDVRLPEDTYQWLRNEEGRRIYPTRIETVVPLIPPRILIDSVKHKLSNYYIIWEVDKWKLMPPRDPILCKRLTPNLFGVLATWDLTELERSIIQARL